MSEERGEVFNLLGRSFDIDKAKSLIKDHEIPKETASLEDLMSLSGFVRVDHDFAIKSENEDPVIAVVIEENGQESLMVIDGYHRLHKWKEEGRKEAEFCVIEGDMVQEIDLTPKSPRRRPKMR